MTESEFIVHTDLCEKKSLPLFEIATVLVRPDHIASFIVNANHGVM